MELRVTIAGFRTTSHNVDLRSLRRNTIIATNRNGLLCLIDMQAYRAPVRNKVSIQRSFEEGGYSIPAIHGTMSSFWPQPQDLVVLGFWPIALISRPAS